MGGIKQFKTCEVDIRGKLLFDKLTGVSVNLGSIWNVYRVDGTSALTIVNDASSFAFQVTLYDGFFQGHFKNVEVQS